MAAVRIPPRARTSLHHLTPRLRGSTSGSIVLLHQICQNEINATFGESELARDYDTIKNLRRHPRIARFVGWIAR